MFLSTLPMVLLLTTHSVNSLECYTTDFAEIESMNFDAKPVVKNCRNFLIDFMDYATVPLNIDGNFQCMTLGIDSDKAKVVVQGCVQKDSCDEFLTALKSRRWFFDENKIHVSEISCSQCQGDLCNGGITRSVTTYKSPERRNYIIAAVVIIILFMIVTAAMLRRLSRKRTFDEGKYAPLKV